MIRFIRGKIKSLLAIQGKELKGSRILMMGLTFKPNVSDIRNSKAIGLAKSLVDSGTHVDAYDPYLDDEVVGSFGLTMPGDLSEMAGRYDALVVATGHDEFARDGYTKLSELLGNPGVMIDIPGILYPGSVDMDDTNDQLYWRP
jgi:UDP-N-acetyl-D-glucosamine/UDP-N-acetyl-D-galactosamine dehydrogenase